MVHWGCNCNFLHFSRVATTLRLSGMLRSSNIVISRKLASTVPTVPSEMCKAWIAYQTVVVYVLLAVVDFILTIRGKLLHLAYWTLLLDLNLELCAVHALYRHNRFVAWFLYCTFLLRVVILWVTSALSLPALTFTARCLIGGTSLGVIHYLRLA